jgi:hypothetical protein
MKDILTEVEAKERWCPIAQVIGDNIDESTDKGIRVRRFGRCVASDCMAWRLAHKPSANGEETGFCGAFGIPRHT